MYFDGLLQGTFKIASVSKVSFLVAPKRRWLVASGEPWVQSRQSTMTQLWVQEEFLPRCTVYAWGDVLGPNAKRSSR